MFRRAAFSAVAALTVGVLAVGCNEDGDTIVSGGGVTRPGNFPGSQVDASNLAADARAMTPPDEDIVDGPEVFWNNANGHAIIMYVTQSSGGTARNLMAHWFDGLVVHPGVQLRILRGGAVEDPDVAPIGYKAMFLNPTGNANANAAARVGDAVILVTRADEAPVVPVGATVHEDSNVRFAGGYFDLSAASAPASGTVIGGFETALTVLDNDNQINGAANDPNVDTFGFVSNALRDTHQQDGGSEDIDSGDVTDYVYFFYGKNQQSGAGVDVINRFRFLTFDMTQATNAMPAAGGTDLTVGAGAYQTGQGADIAGPVLVHNNSLVWNSAAVGNTPAPGDAVVTVTVFNQTTTGGGVATTFALGETPVSGGTTDNTSMPAAENFYGPDHGLNAFYAFYEATGYSTGSPPTTAGDRNPDRDMLATMWPNVASPTPERLEIDAHQGTAVLTGTDQRTNAGGVVTNSIQTRIDRSGNYVAAIWLQRGTDLDTSGGVATRTTNVLWARAIQTRDGNEARTLANSVSTAGPLNAPSLGTGVVTTGALAQADVNNVRFQEDLAGGRTAAQGNGFADRGCSFQGNNLRMNFIYQQLNDQNTAAPVLNQRRLSVNGMVVTLGATDTDRPSQALVSATEVTIETVNQNYAGVNPITARAYDAGDNSRTTATPPVATTSAGRPIVFFASNDNTKTDNTVNGAFPELRLYAWESNTVTTVSTNPSGTTSDLFQFTAFQGAVPVPVNGDTTNSPSHVGNRLHAYWQENSIDGTTRDLATRSYDLTRTQPATGTPPALAERFVPATTAEPVFIDNRRSSNLVSGVLGTNFSIVRGGSTVGVFFTEGRRLFYQQTSTDANGYYKSNGLVTPELVDNESDNPVLTVGISSPNRCDNLSRTIAFFTKQVTTTGNNVARGQVRVLN